jgi:arsenate reductase-like glutaredoxin family protein
LGPKAVEQPDFVLAPKVKFQRDEALDLARACSTIIVAKGKKSLRFDASNSVTDDELAAVILGRSGTLRAPAIRIGQTFVVGFHAEEYEALFG